MSFLKKTTCKKDFWVDENGEVLHIEGESKIPFIDWVYQSAYDGDTVTTQEYISLYDECSCSSDCYQGLGAAASICDDLDGWQEEYEDEEAYVLSFPEVEGVELRKGKCTESFDTLKISLVAALGLGGLYLISRKL